MRRGVGTAVADVRAGVWNPRAGPGVAVLSLVALAGYLALFVVAGRSAGATAPLTHLLALLVPALLAMALPCNIGGWGPREAVAAGMFATAGSGASLGLATAVLYGVLSLVSCLPGLAVLLLRQARVRDGASDPVCDHSPRWRRG